MEKEFLVPVDMSIYWGHVLREVNHTLSANYADYVYISNVYRGIRSNTKIEAVIDSCVATVDEYFKLKGWRPRNKVIRRERIAG